MVTIKGIIGEKPEDAKEGEVYVNLLSVIEQVQKEGEGDVHVMIDSIGGDPEVGFAMYKYLLNLPNNVITECVNNCASAATLPFLAGDNRIAGCPIMIHNPYIDGVSGDKKMLEAAAEWIGKIEKECEDIYTDRTKVDSDTLSLLMDNETYIAPSQAVSLGFATQAKIVALAKLNNSNINKNPKQMSKEKKSIWDLPVFQKFAKERKPKAKAMALTDANGETLTVEREEGDPQVGDKASPDGSFTMPDGKIIIVADGVITEITEASNEGDTVVTEEDAQEIIDVIEEIVQENEELKQENEDLKDQVASAKAKIKSADDIEILNAIMKAGGKEWLAKQCSHYKPQTRTGAKGKKDNQPTSNALVDRINEIKEKGGLK